MIEKKEIANEKIILIGTIKPGETDELIQEHKEQGNLRKIESLEQKLINNLDESSYLELIKLKNQLNRD